jgi:hypothetical protein
VWFLPSDAYHQIVGRQAGGYARRVAAIRAVPALQTLGANAVRRLADGCGEVCYPAGHTIVLQERKKAVSQAASGASDEFEPLFKYGDLTLAGHRQVYDPQGAAAKDAAVTAVPGDNLPRPMSAKADSTTRPMSAAEMALHTDANRYLYIIQSGKVVCRRRDGGEGYPPVTNLVSQPVKPARQSVIESSSVLVLAQIDTSEQGPTDRLHAND